MKRATQNDVARLAGVSRATVSYVLNGRNDGTIRVSDETRKKIVEVMHEIGYRVNMNARGLKTNKSQLIAILVPDLGNPFYPLLIRGAQKQAHSCGYRLLISDSFSSEEGEREFMETALDRSTDGLILDSSYLERTDIKMLLDAGIPSVGIGPRLADSGIDTISIDQRAAIRSLLDHLEYRGHSRIAHLSGDRNNLNGKIRYEVFLQEMKSRGLCVDERYILEGTFLREGIAAKTEKWLASFAPQERPTAIFAANDLMAIEAIKAIQKIGLRIPGDVAVCGFDNIPEAEYVEPPLTSIGFDVESMGKAAAKLLIDRIEGESYDKPQAIGLTFELFARKST